jgi:hypothetical protein
MAMARLAVRVNYMIFGIFSAPLRLCGEMFS